jgi:hypothetical protein
MDHPNQSKLNPRPITTAQWEAVHAITDSVGRRGVRIYGLPREQLAAVVVAIIFVGIPFFVFLSMISAWDYIGGLWWVSRINEYIAPAINSLDIRYRADGLPRFPVKRFVVAAEIITASLFCINFAFVHPQDSQTCAVGLDVFRSQKNIHFSFCKRSRIHYRMVHFVL